MIIKRRLARQRSEFDKAAKTLVRKSASSTEMLNKAKEIFDMAADFAPHGPTISATLTHLVRFEGEWPHFPNDTHAINCLAVGKLVFYGAPLSSLI